jgi:hypothetical protein
MRDVIKYVRSDILPLPPSSNDVRVKGAPNTYRLTQIALEASQRQQQRMMNRSVNSTAVNSQPRQVKTPYPNQMTVFNVPIR